jgi:beta-galactosidase
MQLGVCYYPEHWPEAWWADDARRMREVGIRFVRFAEFAWSRIEPEPGRFDWAWLDRAIETLHAQGLKVVMCTPTATPPKWLVDADPGMLAIGADGRPRTFGSRRHYCFSSPGYRAQSQRITRAVAERYGQHPAVVAWQTDNEYGCHDTVLSYSEAAVRGFRRWLQARYRHIGALNEAWGTVFWSQEYRDFDEVDLPVATVTEATPAHRLDHRRFASDEVVAFNREQVEILRALSPGRDVVHNFMGFFTEFDHHDVSADLDVATWDSYPLGFTQSFFLSADEKVAYARTGHPDIPAFHHDLYRGMCTGANRGRWWVMEQQPGPVNWAAWNPAPVDGMVRLWTWQAFAHGAEVVSYFRWRQAPFAQEQMHAGLNRPDRSLDQGGTEATQVGRELAELAAQGLLADAAQPHAVRAPVALVFDYASIWMARIQPQGADYNPVELCFRVYSVLRALGLDVDIVSSKAPLDGYRLVVLPAQLHDDAALLARLQAGSAQLVFGPRSFSKTVNLSIPAALPPGGAAELAGVRVLRVASLPPGVVDAVQFGSQGARATRWREDLQAAAGAVADASFADGAPAVVRLGRSRYVGCWLDDAGWQAVLGAAARDAGLVPQPLPEGLRTSRVGGFVVACNFSNDTVPWAPSTHAGCLIGGRELAPRGVSLWKAAPST